MTPAQAQAEKMRRINKREAQAIEPASNLPANFLTTSVISSISSVKKDKTTFDTLIARTLLDIIMNGVDNKEKMSAIDRYQKLTQSNRMLVQAGNKSAAIETDGDSSTTLHIDLSSHVNSDEPEEQLQIVSRDLVAEKNAKIFSEASLAEDADFEVIS